MSTTFAPVRPGLLPHAFASYERDGDSVTYTVDMRGPDGEYELDLPYGDATGERHHVVIADGQAAVTRTYLAVPITPEPKRSLTSDEAAEVLAAYQARVADQVAAQLLREQADQSTAAARSSIMAAKTAEEVQAAAVALGVTPDPPPAGAVAPSLFASLVTFLGGGT